MADEDIERTEDRKASKERDKRIERSIAKEWAKAGYYRRKHLQGIRSQGDGEVLRIFYHQERGTERPLNVSCWLAVQDIYEVIRELHEISNRRA